MRSLRSVAVPLLVTLLVALAACGQPASPPPAVPAQIEWFPGDVDAAFAASRETGRPVLIFWGAEWCPDCQQLKSSVFSRPDFIAKSRLFVPVYLDGDLPGAQQWGDVFRVTGYPTVVVLDGSRREITRLAGGMDLNLYAELLDNALGDVRPVTELVGLARRGGELSADDCRRLAYHAFGLEDAEVFPTDELVAALQGAAARCPAQSPRLRLRAAVTVARAPATPAALATALGTLDETLTDRPTALANLDLVMGLDAAFFSAARQAAPARAASVAQRLLALADAAAGDSRFAPADQLYALRLGLRAAASLAPDGRPGDERVSASRARAASMVAEPRGAFEHASVVNAALNVYRELGESDRARELLTAEAASSKRPWYYLGDLAALEEEAGNRDRAIALLAEAYAVAVGPASRFQWGYNYLSGLLRLAPDDRDTIETVGRQLIGELGGPQDVHRRTRLRMQRLGEQLRDWATEDPRRRDVLAALDAALADTCGPAPAGATAQGCASLLRSAH